MIEESKLRNPKQRFTQDEGSNEYGSSANDSEGDEHNYDGSQESDEGPGGQSFYSMDSQSDSDHSDNHGDKKQKSKNKRKKTKFD